MTSRPDAGRDCLPLLQFVLERGNVTVFEWRIGKRPTRVEAVELDFGFSDNEDDAAKDVNNGEVSGVLFQSVSLGNETTC